MAGQPTCLAMNWETQNAFRKNKGGSGSKDPKKNAIFPHFQTPFHHDLVLYGDVSQLPEQDSRAGASWALRADKWAAREVPGLPYMGQILTHEFPILGNHLTASLLWWRSARWRSASTKGRFWRMENFHSGGFRERQTLYLNMGLPAPRWAYKQ